MPDATPYDPIAAGERAIADAPLTMRAARAGGPGGQHVNTTDSAVTISVAVDDLTLDETQREQLTKRLRTRITAAACSPRARRTSAASTRTGASPASGWRA